MLVGTIGILVFLALCFMGLPIALALVMVSACGFIYVAGMDQMVAMAGSLFFRYVAQYSFSVIPMFVFMGQLGYYSGIAEEIFEVARKWLARLPGGLAVSVEASAAMFAACSGSSIAACVTIGKSAIPVMRRSGYSDAMATGVVAAGGTIASLIPPSITIVIFGLLVEESIGKLLIAGFIPGIVTALIYIGFIMIRSRGKGRLIEEVTWRQRFYSMRYLWVVPVIVLAIIGGIYGGIATPTEAGAVGALTILCLALSRRRVTWNILWRSIRETVITTGMILIIVAAAVFFGRFLVISGFTGILTGTIAALEVPRFVIFLLVTAVYFLLGCFMGATAMMIVTVPVFYPLMLSLGFGSLWFGIIVVKYCEMAVITPPVGVNLYAVQSVAKDVPIGTIIRGTAPFLTMDLLTIGIFYLFPQIIEFLPSIM